MDFDTSVVLSEDAVLNVVSPLASFDFSAKVLSALPEGVKAADLGCGRILVDYSTMLQTRYVLCDIYEEDGGEDGTFRYRIVVKSGKKSSRICDALIGLLFILCFWTAGKWFTDGFQRVHMSSLRKKLKAGLGYDPIVNKIGEGYKIGGNSKA